MSEHLIRALGHFAKSAAADTNQFWAPGRKQIAWVKDQKLREKSFIEWCEVQLLQRVKNNNFSSHSDSLNRKLMVACSSGNIRNRTEENQEPANGFLLITTSYIKDRALHKPRDKPFKNAKISVWRYSAQMFYLTQKTHLQKPINFRSWKCY